MITSKTPFRISFFGGGTDYPAWYLKNGGSVIGGAIDKYCYLICRQLPPFFDHRIRVTYSNIELCKNTSEIQHPSVREVMNFLKIPYGLEIHHVGDLPARTGIGSSSSFTVGLINALSALLGKTVSKKALMESAIHVEQKMIQEAVGSQDQTFAAYGGLNYITFQPSGEIVVKPIIMPKDRLEHFQNHLMLFYTGVSRMASTVATRVVQNFEKKKHELGLFQQFVNDGLGILTSGNDFKDFGKLLDEGWKIKRGLAEGVTTDAIDSIYAKAKQAGALGGKILGAGGGGFLLVFVEPEKRDQVKEALEDFLHVPFRFEFAGSQIVVYEPDEIKYDLREYVKLTPPPSTGPF